MPQPFSFKDKAIGIQDETTFGTEASLSGAYDQLDMEPSAVQMDVQYEESENANSVRHQLATDVDVNADQALPVLPLNGNAKKLDLHRFLAAWFQACSETGSAPYKKEHLLPLTGAMQPDFEANAGYFYSLVGKSPQANSSILIKDAICKVLGFSLEGRGRLQVASEWIGRGVPDHTAAPTGTWGIKANDFYRHGRLSTVKIDLGAGDLDVVCKGFSLNLNADVEGVGHDTGNYETLYIGNRKMDFSFTFGYGANSPTAFAALKAGTIVTVKLGWGNTTPGTVDGDLYFEFTAKCREVVDDNEGYLGTQLTGQVVGSDISSNPISIILADNQLRGY